MSAKSLRKVTHFNAATPELTRSLQELETNLGKAVDDLRADSVARARRVVARETGLLVRPGERVVVDNGASLELVLAQPSNDADGVELTVVKKLAAGVITLRPTLSTINGAASATIAATGVTRVLVDAGGYWL